jgi:hypothetical protein
MKHNRVLTHSKLVKVDTNLQNKFSLPSLHPLGLNLFLSLLKLVVDALHKRWCGLRSYRCQAPHRCLQSCSHLANRNSIPLTQWLSFSISSAPSHHQCTFCHFEADFFKFII